MDTRSFIKQAVTIATSLHRRHTLDKSLNGGSYAGLNVSAELTEVKYIQEPSRPYGGSFLPLNWWRELKSASANVDSTGRPVGEVFVIYSYSTPIAWYDENRSEWVLPNVFMSPTTARHQAYVWQTISGRGLAYRSEPIVPANYRDDRGYVIRDLVEYDEAGKIK